MTTRFAFVPVVPSFVGAHQEEAVVAEYAAALAARGGERQDLGGLTGEAPLFYLVATGGTEGVVMDLRAARAATAPDEPVFLIAHPGDNSLPASLEVLARLQRDGTRGRIFYLSGPGDADGLAAIERAAEDLTVHAALAAARIGLVGDPSDWLVASMPSAEVVREVWGPQIIDVPMSELMARLQSAAAEPSPASAAVLAAGASGVVEPTDGDIEAAARVYEALQRLVRDHRLDAVTIRCFDLVLESRTAGCFALSELTDEGIIAGCEGDLVSTVGLLWSRLLTGQTPWMANPAQIDESANALWLAHCTVPRSLVAQYRLRSHFESGLGVGIQGVLPNGPVTLVRIGGARMEQLWLAEGEIVESGNSENLCRTQARVHLMRGHVSELLRFPLGNHVVLVPGHHGDRLRGYWEALV